ncbi:hypothetical protein AB0I28_08030 [Phytomonospora sp. NPDC050363]|uniref:hypothetical protein n=1 Tax=Phytomonospora sp. NPDC050363 TaxID=3155642 RepID=UPI0033DD5708
MDTTAPPRRQRAVPIVTALAFTLVYLALRLYWALGGRLAYTACVPSEAEPAGRLADGCGAADLATLPFTAGWGAVLLAALAVGAAGMACLRLKAAEPALWLTSAALLVASFPGHLLFQIPAGLIGRPTDWRDIAHRTILLAGALVTAWAAVGFAKARRCPHPHVREPRRPARWARWSSYAACAVPILGFSVPHMLWMLGVPFGASQATLDEIRTDLDPATAIALCAAPALGGLVSLGLGMRWGQVLFGRTIPRALALAPAAIVSAALVAYGFIGIYLMGRDLSTGAAKWADMARDWSLFGTEFVFLGWGIALSAATWGYVLATRPRCATCEGADGQAPPAPPTTTTSPA